MARPARATPSILIRVGYQRDLPSTLRALRESPMTTSDAGAERAHTWHRASGAFRQWDARRGTPGSGACFREWPGDRRSWHVGEKLPLELRPAFGERMPGENILEGRVGEAAQAQVGAISNCSRIRVANFRKSCSESFTLEACAPMAPSEGLRRKMGLRASVAIGIKLR